MPWCIREAQDAGYIFRFRTLDEAAFVLAGGETRRIQEGVQEVLRLEKEGILIPEGSGFVLTTSKKLLKRAKVVIFRWCIQKIEASLQRPLTDAEILSCAPVNQVSRGECLM